MLLGINGARKLVIADGQIYDPGLKCTLCLNAIRLDQESPRLILVCDVEYDS